MSKGKTELDKDELIEKVAFRYGMQEGGLRDARSKLMRKRIDLGMKQIKPLVQAIMDSTDPEKIKAKKKELGELKERIRTGSSGEQQEANKWYWAVRYLDEGIKQKLKEMGLFQPIYEIPVEVEKGAEELRKTKQNNHNKRKNTNKQTNGGNSKKEKK